MADRTMPARIAGFRCSLNRMAASSSVAPGLSVTTMAALPAGTSCRLSMKKVE